MAGSNTTWEVVYTLCPISCRGCKRCCPPRRLIGFPRAEATGIASKSASAIHTKGRKKRASFLPDTTTAYASEGFCALSSPTRTYSLWRPQFWRENDVNSDNQQLLEIFFTLNHPSYLGLQSSMLFISLRGVYSCGAFPALRFFCRSKTSSLCITFGTTISCTALCHPLPSPRCGRAHILTETH